jgi:hypothetical protein
VKTPGSGDAGTAGQAQAGQTSQGLFSPGLGLRLNRLSGADKLMTAVADYREAARTNPAPRSNGQPA